MNYRIWSILFSFSLMGVIGCSHPHAIVFRSAKVNAVEHTIEVVKTRFAPDPHLAVFNVGMDTKSLVLTGEVSSVQAKTTLVDEIKSIGLPIKDEIAVLPAEELGDKTWGIARLSAAYGRETPEHKGEMGTEVFMGRTVRIWKRIGTGKLQWYLTQSQDGYLSWQESGTLFRCTQAEMAAWTNSPLLIVTAFESQISERPCSNSLPVSDVVIADLVKKIGEEGDWFQVELPDGRIGYILKSAVQDYRAWRKSRQPTPEHIEQTARMLLGRPYLWGGNTPRGLDCSGLTKLTFLLNGIDLNRNASHQARQGILIPVNSGLDGLKKGDLIFFGRPAIDDRPERVTHTGIYLGDKLFIHSSGCVRINSLDPASPIRDESRIRSLLYGRRVLPDQ